jgi:hypothetical protein
MVWSVVVVALSTLAACQSGQPLSSILVANGPPPDASSGGAADTAPAKTLIAEADAAADAAAETAPPVLASPKPDASMIIIVEPKTDAAPPDVAPVPDAATPDAPTDAAPLLSCAALAAAGAPVRLKTFEWDYQSPLPFDGPYQAPYDHITITDGCVLTYQGTIKPPAPKATTQTVTMDASDCAAARGWGTNARFLEVLATGDGCPYGEGNPGDAFELTLSDIGDVRRKTYLCPEPTLEAVRACLRPLIARLFPN